MTAPCPSQVALVHAAPPTCDTHRLHWTDNAAAVVDATAACRPRARVCDWVVGLALAPTAVSHRRLRHASQHIADWWAAPVLANRTPYRESSDDYAPRRLARHLQRRRCRCACHQRWHVAAAKGKKLQRDVTICSFSYINLIELDRLSNAGSASRKVSCNKISLSLQSF